MPFIRSIRSLAAALIVFLAACVTVEDAVQPVRAETPKDPFELIKAEITGDSLTVTVQYSGGSAEHEFTLESKGAATKSLPRQQMFALHHDAHGDRARALITEERRFSLTAWQDPRNTVVHIRLEGWEEVLVYSYER